MITKCAAFLLIIRLFLPHNPDPPAFRDFAIHEKIAKSAEKRDGRDIYHFGCEKGVPAAILKKWWLLIGCTQTRHYVFPYSIRDMGQSER